jgi:hypothetical protein
VVIELEVFLSMLEDVLETCYGTDWYYTFDCEDYTSISLYVPTNTRGYTVLGVQNECFS